MTPGPPVQVAGRKVLPQVLHPLFHILPGSLLVSEVTAKVVPLEIVVGVALLCDVGGDLRGAVSQDYLRITYPATVNDLIALAHPLLRHPVSSLERPPF